ncbi:hypothetical protein RHGRI_019847 [Rhododendron griersonianum]|uniref:Uncharacterized protein n=1 Tax=Rhododendron griersonianum TaxID=479676 RepID=A0AAV6JE92_9ERIC|nr:hypothetical protein RHGRI_019847 [Rhododendron griersonianum]
MDYWRRSSARSRQAATGLSLKARVEIKMRGRRSSTASRKALASTGSNQIGVNGVQRASSSEGMM